jgi:hypothetical protein
MNDHALRHGIAATAGLLALSLFSTLPTLAGDTLPRDCEAILAALRRFEAATNEALSEVHNHRLEAQRLGEWFGMEEFEPYADILREQEQKLRLQIQEIRQMACQLASVAPPDGTSR